jgi:hypothetical protein
LSHCGPFQAARALRPSRDDAAQDLAVHGEHLRLLVVSQALKRSEPAEIPGAIDEDVERRKADGGGSRPRIRSACDP